MNVPNDYIPLNGQRRQTHSINGSGVLIRTTLNGTSLGNGSNVWPSQSNIGKLITPSAGWTNSYKATTSGVRKQKRVRTAFTSNQMMELEQEYSRTRYLDRARRLELAELLHLNERTIKIWFQNRRMKEKKDKAESLEEMEESNMAGSSPEINSTSMLIHEQYPAPVSTEIYNRVGVYIDQYPVVSTPALAPVTNQQILPAQLLTQAIPNVNENGCSSYTPQDHSQSQYQHLHLQLQHYRAPYSIDVEELSPQSVTQSEGSPRNVSSDIIEKSWDLSWIKSINADEEYQ